jgi:hypothetical protein
MSTITLNKQNTQSTPQDKLYIKIKEKTVIYYSVTKDLTDDQLEGMMVESAPFGYTETYI